MSGGPLSYTDSKGLAGERRVVPRANNEPIENDVAVAEMQELLRLIRVRDPGYRYSYIRNEGQGFNQQDVDALRAVLLRQQNSLECEKTGTFPESFFNVKAPKQVTPGTATLNGQYINDKGRFEPWEAFYDQCGRQKSRTDYNAGNKVQGIPDTHCHTYKYDPGVNGQETDSHVPGEYGR